MRAILFLFVLIIQVKILNAQADPNARDLVKLTEWFEGEFDNDSQIWFEGRRSWKGKEEEKHDRLHTFHKRLILPEIGEHVFYVEEYTNDDPSNVTRQRIVNFESEESGIKMSIYFLKQPENYSIHDKSSSFSLLSKDELFTMETCAVYFTRQGEQYHGSMREKECQFGEDKLKRYSKHDMIISENQYWRVDRSFLTSDDTFHKGHPNDEPHKMRKVGYYTCNVSFYEKAYYMPSKNDRKYEDVHIHDQGGTVILENPLDGNKYILQIREKEYPFYKEGSDFFMLRFKQEGELASKLIVTSEPNTPKISFSMGWASADCKRL